MKRGRRSLSRTLGLVAALGCAAMLVAGCERDSAPGDHPRVLLLGFDGLDPRLLDLFMKEGELPNFRRLASEGNYRPLGTTIPAQSPVAWSTFITGMDPGGHGIYDFIHRDPAPPGGGALLPYLSTSKVEEGESLELGSWKLPIRAGDTELLRRGQAFWNVLAEHGVPATVVKIPANFPPEPSEARTLSDMGTPDLRGTYGTFTLFTSDPAVRAGSVSGGVIEKVRVEDGHVAARVTGPENPFRTGRELAAVDVDVFVDRASEAVKIEIQGQEIVLGVGEWSDWIHASFDFLPTIGTPGILRFRLLEVEPHFRLYASPVNIDPTDPALPISTPEDYAVELGETVGAFYTQGLPEDTAALTAGALADEGFLEQARIIFEERLRLFETELTRFEEGLLFVYFGGPDQVSHMFWRVFDEPDPTSFAPDNPILRSYREVDEVLGRALARLGDDDTLIVLSDHGFAPFRRQVHLNSWLREAGYQTLRPGKKEGGELFRDVDWSQTRAYGLGLNGLYLNLVTRERHGTVTLREREPLLAEITRRLLEWTDPDTGDRVVSKVYRQEDVYTGAHRDVVPDLVVGYARGYRVSNGSALGRSPVAAIEDNGAKWSGDHCIDVSEVPGVLLTNRRLVDGQASLLDVAPTLLAEFDLEPTPEMTGRSFLLPEKGR